MVALQVPELTSGRLRPWSARLFYAYADALLAAGREDEARDAFARAADADTHGETDAAERLDELDGIELEDLAEFDDEDEFEDPSEFEGEAGSGDSSEFGGEAESGDSSEVEGEAGSGDSSGFGGEAESDEPAP